MIKTKENIMNEPIKELVAIGASVGAHCQPCLEYHLQVAIELGLTENDIRQAVEIGHAVEKGAMTAMKKFSDETVEEFLDAAAQAGQTGKQAEKTSEKSSGERALKIYDPAMCCSSGVCGPSVDPLLAQFAGALKFVADRPNIHFERYNLGQQPQAFVENAEVKSILGNGGEKTASLYFHQ
ncbi:MAG: arsenic metallochaperone ArsD family protein [Deltaproteobacteria bacterium]|nr:arsenic metallochaperone ArsD family protein [Deltaproteobacteria bacterium]